MPTEVLQPIQETWRETNERAQRLRRELYSQTDPGASTELLDELEAVEKDLVSKPRPKPVLDPTVLSTKPEAPTNLLSAETTGLIVDIKLKMTQVPGSIVHLLNASTYPLVSVSVQNGKADRVRRVRVTTCVEGYSAHSVDTVELRPAAKPHEFSQLPTFFPQSLAHLHELTKATLNVNVEDLDGRVDTEATRTIWIAPRTTALLSTFDPAADAYVDFTGFLGAYVTPNDPAIMLFLRKAAQGHASGRLVGYQGNQAGGVGDQVSALFNALKTEASIAYINSVIAFNTQEGVTSQRVRLPRESIEARSANCLDGAVLFASLLEAISLSPALILIPGHAFVAWERWTGTNQWSYLETTMVGTHTFAEACAAGEALAARFAGMNPSPMKTIEIRDLRAKGIFPMT